MSAAVTKFLTDLRVHFPPKLPRPELEKAWVLSITQVLKGYSTEVLERAAREIIATRTRTDFPRPAECKKACEEVMRWMDAERRAGGLPVVSGHNPFEKGDYSTSRIDLADDLVNCGLGKQAARDGWILSLHDFCRKHARLPEGSDVAACKRGASEFGEAYAECVRGNPQYPGWAQQSVMRDLGDKMLKRRAELAEMVLNGVVRR